MKSLQNSIENLRKAGLKITPQRRAIIEIFEKNPHHPTAEQVYVEIKQKMPDISLTTVYNTLNELNNLGELDVVRDIHEPSNRYDPNTEDHNHLYCLSCGRIIDLSDGFSGLDLDEEKRSGFRIMRKQVTFYGFCPECQPREETVGD